MSESPLAWRFAPQQNAYTLEQVSLADRPLGPHDVRLRVDAVSLNYRDLVALKNLAGRPVSGKIPCSDGAGTVIEVGSSVQRVSVGQRVVASFFQKWLDGRFDLAYHQSDLGGHNDGMLAEEVILDEHGLVAVPDSMSQSIASTLPCAGVTAWAALTRRGHLQPGETVLCLGTGGVSIFALQLAKALGGRVIVTSRSEEKLARARELGAWATINTKNTPDWDKEVWLLTERRGVDHVIEVGGPGTLEKSMASLGGGGHLALIGVLTGFGPPMTSLFPLLSRNIRLSGLYVGSRADLETLTQFILQQELQPVIDREFSFDKAPEAFDYVASGEHVGKVVIRISNA